MRLTIGTDLHAAAGFGLIEKDIAPRVAVSPIPHHWFVLRGGLGTAELIEGESDLPDNYSQRYFTVGYRGQLEHAYFGVDFGREYYLAHYSGEEAQYHTPEWRDITTLSAVAGAKLGPVDIGFDFEGHGRFGVHVGVDLGRFSL